tara:strand:+ start:4102 stop:6465 length:2364 start_codon:yes stop_codon:yes gene_type:complete
MAQLPKYKPSTTEYAGMRSLTSAAAQQQVATNERLNKFLGEATKYFQAEAVDYATDKAIEDAIRNPITGEQLEQARQTGGNPIVDYLKGGSAYNDAITKTLGQQVAGELNIELSKYNADVLDQVKLGKFNNSEEVLAKLREPIQAQVEFFSQIDPEMARTYGSRATLNAQNVYQTSNQIFSQQREAQAEENAYIAIDQEVNNYSKYLSAHPNATNEQKRIYRETVEKFVTDTTLSMSKNQSKLNQRLQSKLQNIDDLSMAEDIAIAYTGNNINETLNDLDKYDITKDKYSGETLEPDQYELAKYYHNMDLEEQTRFKLLVNNALSVANSGLAEIQRKVKANVKESKIYIDTFQPIPQGLVDKINKNIDVDSDVYTAWQTLQKFSNNIETYNTTPYVELVADLNAMGENMMDITKVKNPEELATFDLLNRYVTNINTAFKNDSVGTMIKRAGVSEPLDFSNLEELPGQVQNRQKQLGTYGPLYGLSESQYTANIMTKSEVSGFVNAYMNGDGATRVALLQTIDKGFGNSNSQALMQLVDGGLPATAELSSYFGDPMLTEKLISFDSKEKRDDLKAFAKDNETSYQAIRIMVRDKLEDFEQVVMIGSNFNTTVATKKLETITDTLTYLAIQEMQTNAGYDENDGAEAAADLVNNAFTLEDNYYIPNIYNGNGTNPEEIANKANLIKDHYLEDFNPIAFRSTNPDITDDEYEEEMRNQMIENGVWRNSADGTSLVYGIVLPAVGFTPIENSQGQLLSFKFNDLSFTLPNSNIEMDVSKKRNNTFGYRIGG